MRFLVFYSCVHRKNIVKTDTKLKILLLFEILGGMVNL